MKERLLTTLKGFFVSTVLINIAMFVCGMLLRPEQKFGYEAFMYPLLYGLLASVPTFIMYTKKELTVRREIIRKVVQVMLIIAIIEAFMFTGYEATPELIKIAVFVAVSIAVVYAGAVLIVYALDAKKARGMTEELKRFQKREAEDCR